MSTSTILEDTSKFSKYTRQELEKLCYNYSRMIAKQEERMKEVNELLASNLAEIRQLKEINRKLNLDNKQLQDLCCFIDNERLEGRKLAKEWQKFGRYSADVVKKEVPQYREKLKELQYLQECVVDAVSFVLDMHTNSEYMSSEILTPCNTELNILRNDTKIESADMNASVSSREAPDVGFWRRDLSYSHKKTNSSASETSAAISILPVQTVVHPKDFKVQEFSQSGQEMESGSAADLSGHGCEFSRSMGTSWARSSLHGRYHRKRYSSKTLKSSQNDTSDSRSSNMENMNLPPNQKAVIAVKTNRNEGVAAAERDKVISGANIEVCEIGDSSGSDSEEANLPPGDDIEGNGERIRENLQDIRSLALNSGCLATL